MELQPFRVLPSFRPKIWGSENLGPWFERQSEKIGEIWFTSDENLTSSGRRLGDLVRELGPALLGPEAACGDFPILVKLIFTTERLSIQVHPDDARAIRSGGRRGKSEMWYILHAEPGAEVALGLQEKITRERLRQAAASGELERLVEWMPVQAGETYLAEAGTVHAIGAGLVLCEIQQNCDITYRLYDYGRPREMHLDQGSEVAILSSHPGRSTPVELPGGGKLLARSPYFATELMELSGALNYEPDAARFHLLIVVEGNGALGSERFQSGECWVIPATAKPFCIAPEGRVRMLKTYVPPQG